MWRANKGIPCRSIRFIKLYIFVCGVQQCSISVVIHKQQSKYVRFHKYITQEISIIYAHGSRLISFSFVSTQKIKKKIRLAHSNTYTHTHTHVHLNRSSALFIRSAESHCFSWRRCVILLLLLLLHMYV